MITIINYAVWKGWIFFFFLFEMLSVVFAVPFYIQQVRSSMAIDYSLFIFYFIPLFIIQLPSPIM